jgi:hypothetical protein
MERFSEDLAEHGGWEFDLATRAPAWSDGVFRIHGVRPGEFRPSMEAVRELIHPDDLAAYRQAFRNAVASRAPFIVQHRIVRPDGTVRTVIVRGAYSRTP